MTSASEVDEVAVSSRGTGPLRLAFLALGMAVDALLHRDRVARREGVLHGDVEHVVVRGLAAQRLLRLVAEHGLVVAHFAAARAGGWIRGGGKGNHGISWADAVLRAASGDALLTLDARRPSASISVLAPEHVLRGHCPMLRGSISAVCRKRLMTHRHAPPAWSSLSAASRCSCALRD